MAFEHDGSESLNEATPQSPEGDVSSEQLAQNPEIQAKFAEVFGSADNASAEGEVETTAQDAADAEQQDELVESKLVARRDEGSQDDSNETGDIPHLQNNDIWDVTFFPARRVRRHR